MQTRTGARSNLKGLLQEIKITAMLEKLETRKMHKRDAKQNSAKTRKEPWEHGKTNDTRNRQTGVTVRI